MSVRFWIRFARFLLPLESMGGDNCPKSSGIDMLLETYRKKFRIAENLNHYSEENFKIAERKYLKFALAMGESKDHSE